MEKVTCGAVIPLRYAAVDVSWMGVSVASGPEAGLATTVAMAA